MYYDDVEYANKRLAGTLVRKSNGDPFQVTEVIQQGKDVFCTGYDLKTDVVELVLLSDIDLTPVPLGFFNVSGKMVFACRKPLRRDWKQGLAVSNLILYGLGGTRFNFKLLNQPIFNSYPSFEKSVDYADKNKEKSMAFSREFGVSSVGGVIKLCYRKYEVGEIKNLVPVLDKSKFFLEEHLEESLKGRA